MDADANKTRLRQRVRRRFVRPKLLKGWVKAPAIGIGSSGVSVTVEGVMGMDISGGQRRAQFAVRGIRESLVQKRQLLPPRSSIKSYILFNY